jgi:hypothetical protein
VFRKPFTAFTLLRLLRLSFFYLVLYETTRTIAAAVAFHRIAVTGVV